MSIARTSEPARKIDFNRDIRPILSDNCFSCHGPDEKQRKATLRLDQHEGVLKEVESGNRAIVPGNTEESELIARVEADEETIKMPPPKSGKSLSAEQIALLRQWVEEGATWSSHWAFEPPVRSPVPSVSDKAWPLNPIDYFIIAGLDEAKLRPSAEADKITLIRRATLDLTGLPPTPQEVDAFLADTSPDAYESLVDRLLDSPRYGENMARYWLDAARFGDTHGLHLDNYREIWPYRDWVIHAFNSNKPFDKFVVEQVAGDLVPNPTRDQLVATGYNRCHVSTSEGGSIEEEVYVRNVVDQVDTNGTVFLGLTVGCARCHDHKYDPIRMKDYYQLFAFFNSIDGKALDGNNARWAPVLQIATEEQTAKLASLKQRTTELRKTIRDEVAKIVYDESADADESEFVRRNDFVWFDDEIPAGAKASDEKGFTYGSNPDYPVLSGRRAVKQTFEGQGQQSFEGASRRLKVGEGDSLFVYVFIDPTKPPKEIMLQWNTDGWKHRAYWGENLIDFGKDGTGERHKVGPLPKTGEWVRLEVDAAKVGLAPGAMISGLSFTQHGGTAFFDNAGLRTWTPQDGQVYDTLASWIRTAKTILEKDATIPKAVKDIVKLERAQRSEEQRKQLRDHFVEKAYSKTRPIFEPLSQELAQADKAYEDFNASIPTTLVSKESEKPKPAFMLDRGEYDRKKDEVGRATPGFLPPMPEGSPTNRLGFAQWLVAPNHPLTSRVAVNRFWQQFFGTGLVKTAEDFGAQGEPPSHPELLDWLAVQFMSDGWDVKAFVKRMMMSATYRQSSRVTKEGLIKDPGNRLLSRGPRYRLDAETLRDQALYLGGLLVERMGGPSVKPPQPAGLWEAVGYTSSNTAKFVADQGADKVHRRSMYIFWKRTSAPPQMTTFDAPSREACQVRRERTNTPLQALLMMNEPQFVESSRALAERVLREGGTTDADRLTYMFRLATGRKPESSELSELAAALSDHRGTYREKVEDAKKLISIGESKPSESVDPTELAAWTLMGNLMLNLDEAINRG